MTIRRICVLSIATRKWLSTTKEAFSMTKLSSNIRERKPVRKVNIPVRKSYSK